MLANHLRPLRAVAAALLAVAAGSSAAAAATGADSPAGACSDPTGVTVVVDSTELGGEVTVACAADPATGTEALAQAGVSESRDPSGYICAVGGRPDPCPTEFTGSYWGYWSAGPDGEWTSYMEGSDTAVPEPGSVEGWRWGDGTRPPAVDVADVLPGAPAAADGGAGTVTTPDPTAADDAPVDTSSDVADAAGAADAADTGGSGTNSMSPVLGVAVGAAILAGLVATIVRLRRHSDGRADD